MNLGDLEKSVLQYFWEHQEADAKRVHAYFHAQRGGSLNTIQSTLDRLYKKGLLKRAKQSHAFVYTRAFSRESFISHLVTDVTRDFLEPGENALHAAFASISQSMNDGELDELERLIESRRKDSEGGER